MSPPGAATARDEPGRTDRALWVLVALAAGILGVLVVWFLVWLGMDPYER